MMRSMFTGVSGLRVHQTRMDVIANNVANVNTVGFKSARATFRDAFYQNMQGATAANPLTGRTGMNPQQIGLGLSMGSIDNIMTQGASQRTDWGMDLMIQNQGMFIVGDQTGTFFTRAGNITQDARGNLGINGMQLMGWDVTLDRGQWIVDRSNLRPLSMSGAKANMPSEATTFIDIAGNLDIRDLVNVTRNADGDVERGDIMRVMTIFDSLGHSYVVDVRFTFHNVPGAPNYWTYEFLGEELPEAQGGGFAVRAFQDGIRRNEDGTDVQPALMRIHAGSLDQLTGGLAANGSNMRPSGTLVFDSNGTLIAMGPTDGRVDHLGVANARPAPVRRFATANPPPTPIPSALPGLPHWQVTMDNFSLYIAPVITRFTPRATLGNVNDVTQYILPAAGAGGTAAAPPEDDLTIGNVSVPVGRLRFNMSSLTHRGGMSTNVNFDPVDGNPPGILSDISIGADGTITGMFTNGRTRTLGQIPVAIFSNPAGLQRMGNNLWAATANSGSFDGIGVIGDIQAGALEMSNVDLAEEFTGMIITQRGFQASSRLISVSDEMIQELVNLRR